MNRVGLFGGTFDPPHIGHRLILQAAAATKFFDKIIVVPAAVPPRKSIINVSMSSYRYEMTNIMVDNYDFDTLVTVSDIELRRKDKSYTIDTIREIKRESCNETEVYLICGSDILYEIETWYKPNELLSETGLFVARRPAIGQTEQEDKANEIRSGYRTDIRFFDAPLIDVSSSVIRDMFKGSFSGLSEYIDPEIETWINTNHIYDSDFDMKCLSEESMTILAGYEIKLREYLSSYRLIHSVNTMRMCVSLAVTNGHPPFKCAVAGLLHDCAKYKHGCNGIQHSYDGSEIVSTEFGIKDEEILDAVKFHTTSRARAGMTEKIVFVADKIEPSRNFRRIEELRELSYSDLDIGYRECLKDIIVSLESKGLKAHRDTYEAYEEMKSK